MVPEVGIEPTRGYPQGILSPQRLPFRHSGSGHVHHSRKLEGDFEFRISNFEFSITLPAALNRIRRPHLMGDLEFTPFFRDSGFLVYWIHGHRQIGQEGADFDSEGRT